MCRELGRLSQDFLNTKGTNTVFFTPRSKVPKKNKVTYMTIVCTHKPSKSDSESVRLCVGGDRLEYDSNIRTPTADMTTVKLLLNSAISTKNAKFMTMDIKKICLGKPMEKYEYGRFNLRDIPQEFIVAHNLEPLFDNKEYVYMEIQRGISGLKQAGNLANEKLQEILIPHG